MTEPGSGAPDRDALRRDRDQVRADLRETVDALAGKLDIGARTAEAVRRRTAQVEQDIRDRVEQARTGAHHVAGHIETHAPEPVTHPGRRAAELLRTRPAAALTGVAAAAAVTTWLILRRRMR